MHLAKCWRLLAFDLSWPLSFQSRPPALLVFMRFVLWCCCVKRSPATGNFFRKVARGAGRFVAWPWHPHMIQAQPTIIELDMGELEDVLRRAEERLDEKDYGLIKAVIESYAYLTELVGDKDTTIRRLRQMLFGAKTEKTSAVVSGLKDAERGSASPETAAMPESSTAPDAEAHAKTEVEVPAEAQSAPDSQASDEKNGHGHNGADAFTGAEKIEVRHELLQPGDPCPKCEQGTLYDTGRPGVLVRLVGQAPVRAVVYYLQKLRCNPCGAIFTAKPPEGVDPE